MYLIPEVKRVVKGEKKAINGCKFFFPENIDERVKKICEKVPCGDAEVFFEIGNGSSEEYKIIFSDKIKRKEKLFRKGRRIS